MIKSLSILTRKPQLSFEEFRKVWTEEHAPLVRAVPEVKKYVLSFTIDTPAKAHVSMLPIQVDAIAELWYVDRAALARAAARPEMAAVLDNGAKYLTAIKTVITEEVDVIG